MTEKQMKKHLNKIWFHYEKLQNALNAAHNDDLIEYKDYNEEAPCWAMRRLYERIKATTQKKISDIIHESFRRRHW